MEKKPTLLYKTLVFGVIVLFIGVGIQPAFANTHDTYENEDDCELCAKKVSKSQLTLLKNLLNRLEKYDDQLPALSELNPEFKEKYQEAYNKLIIFKKLINEFKSDSSNSNNIFLCLPLLILFVSASLVLVFLNPIYWKFEYNLLINIILTIIQIPFDIISLSALTLGEKLNCWEIPWPPWWKNSST